MSSFKLESGGSAKDQAKSAGALLIGLGTVVFFLFDIFVGAGMFAFGLILVVAAFGASS